MKTPKDLIYVSAMVCLSAVVSQAIGQTALSTPNFPTKAITIVVPFPPGGLTDPIARSVGHSLSETFKQSVVIENKAGASGIIAAEFVKKSAADGHVILMAATGHLTTNPLLFSKLPYETRDFAPITLGVSTPHLLVVPGTSPANTVAEMIALAKAKPKGLTYASQGTGGAGHLLGSLLKTRTGVELEHVPYKGSAPGLLDLVAGRVDFFFDAIVSAGPLARDGRLRALAVASPLRAPLFPNVPTMAEAGVPGVELDATFGFVVPAGTPMPVVRKLNEEIVRALRDPALSKTLVDGGLRVIASSPEEYVAFMQAQRELLAKVIKDSGIRLD
ncbi:MAG: Bug family tripartite tricarboxylate transporter substrate binding protein [Burkholderiales bacterium]